jgi:hypothetical protein
MYLCIVKAALLADSSSPVAPSPQRLRRPAEAPQSPAALSQGDLSRPSRRRSGTIRPLQPVDVADAIMWCLSCPEHMEVNDIVIRPTQQVRERV